MASWARIILTGGPFDREEAAFVPPDTAVPAQIVWTGWMPWGFTAYIYEWRGGREMDLGRTAVLLFEFTGRTMADIPPLMAEDTEVWADSAQMIMDAFNMPAEMLWPGI